MNFNGAVKSFVKLVIALTIFILIILLIFKIIIVPKTPATVEQVTEVLTSQGYKPQDITEQYFEKDIGFKQTLINCIAIEKDDIHFEFFNFNNENSAIDIYGQAHSLIVRTKMSIPYAEHDTKNANYCIYTLAAGGTYSVAIYVENTAVYAYSNEENAGAISDILEAIGYFKNNSNNNTVNTAEKRNTRNEMVLFRIVYFFLLLIIHRVSLFWLWAEVRKVAGVTKQEIKEYRIENRRVINPQKKFYFWLLSRSQNPKKFKRLFMTYQICILPSILCFVFAVLGSFTPVFDNALGNMGVIMSGLPIVFAFSAVLYNTCSKKS